MVLLRRFGCWCYLVLICIFFYFGLIACALGSVGLLLWFELFGFLGVRFGSITLLYCLLGWWLFVVGWYWFVLCFGCFGFVCWLLVGYWCCGFRL